MSATVVSFRWLDLLEKEFDKSFVDIKLLSDEIEENDEVENICKIHTKLNNLASCFAQLTHKSQTIFQVNAKLEAQVLNLKHDLATISAKKDLLEKENHDLLVHLHASQLQLHSRTSPRDSSSTDNVDNIREKLEKDLEEERGRRLSLQIPKEEYGLLLKENEYLKRENLNLQAELIGAKLATKYLDKELAGRVQQLQLLNGELNVKDHESLWKQLDAEIHLHRHKTIVRACRTNSLLSSGCNDDAQNSLPSALAKPDPANFHRVVIFHRPLDQGLGLSVTGGREHGIPILISDINNDLLKSDGTVDLFIGDAILSVNDIDLRNVTHKEAVDILSTLEGEIRLEVVFISSDEEEVDGFSMNGDNISLKYRWFDDEVCSIPESFQLLQNGRLSRASIDSVRGSTENILERDEVEFSENSPSGSGDLEEGEVQAIIEGNSNGINGKYSNSPLSTLNVQDSSVLDISDCKTCVVHNFNRCASDIASNDGEKKKNNLEIVSDNSEIKNNVVNSVSQPAAIHETKSKENKD